MLEKIKIFYRLKGYYDLKNRGLLVAFLGHFSDNGSVSVSPRLLRVRILIASRGQFSGITVVSRNAGSILKGLSVESCPAYLASISVCAAAQWGKLSDS